MAEVELAMSLLSCSPSVCLMQCNTNYEGNLLKETGRFLNLNVLKSYAARFPEAVLGLSDHNVESIVVTTAVALGARVIERHFTDDCTRVGPDHAFSMEPQDWERMVTRVQEVETILGSATKWVARNENETRIVQRRCLRAARKLSKGHKIEYADLVALRPAPFDSLDPYEECFLLGKYLKEDMDDGDYFRKVL